MMGMTLVFAILGFSIVVIMTVRCTINVCVIWITLLVRGGLLLYQPSLLMLFAFSLVLFSFSLPYKSFFGGVSALTPDHYMKMNGFPNTYWGSSGENDDIATRY